MGRITCLERDEVPEDIQPIYDEYIKIRGNMPNMFRTLAHAPELMRETNDYFRAVMKPGVISLKLKEMAAVRVSQIHLCGY